MAADGSGDRWGARDPGPCYPFEKSRPPMIDEAAALVRCNREMAYNRTGELWLLEDLKLQMGKGRKHLGEGEELETTNADTSKPVYDLSGSWTLVMCRIPDDVAAEGGEAARNCSHSTFADGTGLCWPTTLGDWDCDVSGSGSAQEAGFPPPRRAPN
jgi:hypothetical protein